MQQYTKTLTELNEALKVKPDDAWALAHRGEVYGQMEDYDKALADLGRAINLRPDYAWALAHRGEVYRQLKRYQEALIDFNRAIELRPDYAWALAHRGATYRFLRHSQEALTDLNRAIELKPDYDWAFGYRAETFGIMRRYEEALADFDQTRTLVSINFWYGERGMLLNYLGRYAETVACCEPVVRQDPQDYIALYSLTVATACWKGVVEAQPLIDKTWLALESMIEPETPVTETRAGALYRLGGLAALLGRTDQALDFLQEAIGLGDEPVEQARHDPPWHGLRLHPRFQALISEANDQG